MYKDKEKQREADKARQQRRRDVIKAKGVTNLGRDGQGVTRSGTRFIPDEPKGSTMEEKEALLCAVIGPPVPEDQPKRGKDIKCITIGDQARSMKTMAMLHSDACKRGKDIKTFEDLSPSIQRVIDVMSTTDGKLDKTIKANRTAIAINYQHLFPDRYHSTGVV